MEIRNYHAAVPFTTTDGSTIRSLLDLSVAPVSNHSLAEASLPEGGMTDRHHHAVAEEMYYLTAGEAIMEIDGEECEVRAGDAILIPPGSWHQIRNTGPGALTLLVTCAPPWTAEDTYFAD
ncbi:MAG: cupin domain-containing protein [Thermoleophilia bacterium]|nr:cupin domain-containing protein [Thermoleophilia bacterium]